MNISQKKLTVIQKCRELIKKGNREYHTQVPDNVSILFNKSAAWGTATVKFSTHQYKLKFSLYALMDEDFNYIINEIVPHEVAHLIAFDMERLGLGKDRAHGEMWKRICLGLGGTGIAKAKSVIRTVRKQFHYKTSDGSDVYVDKKMHDDLQNSYKVYSITQNKRKSTFSAKDFIPSQS